MRGRQRKRERIDREKCRKKEVDIKRRKKEEERTKEDTMMKRRREIGGTLSNLSYEVICERRKWARVIDWHTPKNMYFFTKEIKFSEIHL